VDPPIGAARVVSLAGLGIVLMMSGWFVIALDEPTSRSRVASGARLRAPLVTVQGKVPATRTRVVDVTSLNDLGRVAAQSGAVVLQEARAGFHAYFVHDGDLTYRYQVMGMPEIPTAPSRTRGAT